MATLPTAGGNSQVSAADSDNAAQVDIAGIEVEQDEQNAPGRLDRTLEKLRRTPAGRLGVKITVTVVGSVVVVGGLILVPLPGPGWLIVFAGLAIWSIEYHWARQVNRYARSRVAAWTTWYGEQRWPVRIAVGLVIAVVIAVVIGAAVYFSLGTAPFHRIGIQL